MTKLEAEIELQNVSEEIEDDLELTPGMVGRVLLREHECPGDPLAKEILKLICAKLDPAAQFLLGAGRAGEVGV